jgi:hypothetical protein
VRKRGGRVGERERRKEKVVGYICLENRLRKGGGKKDQKKENMMNQKEKNRKKIY